MDNVTEYISQNAVDFWDRHGMEVMTTGTFWTNGMPRMASTIVWSQGICQTCTDKGTCCCVFNLQEPEHTRENMQHVYHGFMACLRMHAELFEVRSARADSDNECLRYTSLRAYQSYSGWKLG